MLHGLARSGRTVLTTIHQPSSRLFWMFDKVLLLSEGCPIFTGQASQAMNYLDSIGFVPTFSFINPADFLLDLANGLAILLLHLPGFFPLFNAIFAFPLDRPMLIKERSSSMYHLSSYYVAGTVGDLPMELVLPTIFVTISYWMGGLKPSLVTFVFTLLIMLFNVLVSQGIGLALGAIRLMSNKSQP
ncbi:hypothetical protein ACSQ67_005593 [Phaseolus vulgaris]